MTILVQHRRLSIVDTDGKEVLTVNNGISIMSTVPATQLWLLMGRPECDDCWGIGAGALTKLNALGIKVYGSRGPDCQGKPFPIE